MPNRNQVTYSERPTHAARRAHAQGERAFKTYDTSFIRPKRSKLPTIVGAVVLLIVLVALVFGIMSFVRGCMPGSNLISQDETATIIVNEGDNAQTIGKALVQNGLIANANDFTDRVVELGVSGSLKPGTYAFAGGTPIDDIIDAIERGVVSTVFTIPEGCTIAQAGAIIEEATKGQVTAESFERAASNVNAYSGRYKFLADAHATSLEGFLFPKTYAYDSSSTADSLIRAMLAQFQLEVESLDLDYAKLQGLTLYDVVKLASIVEKESDADHRATVASVFYNRLNADMRLQSDATVAYVVGHDPTPSDIEVESPYNTYKIDGLPPTPINSPGLAALEAVCSPDRTNFLYFYFAPDESGTMQYYFSETYDEHRATYE